MKEPSKLELTGMISMVNVTKEAKTRPPTFSTLKTVTSKTRLATVTNTDGKPNSKQNAKETHEKKRQIKFRPESF